MTDTEKSGVLARKFAAQRLADTQVDFAAPDLAASAQVISVDPVQRAWRGALARAARDQMKMALGFETLRVDTVGLTEVLETPMERALILMLEGAGEQMGLIVISPPLLGAMIEMLTLAHLAPDPAADDDDGPRKPTRTDAAMVVDMIDAALAAFEAALAGLEAWSAGYRFGAFIEDPRPLNLLLDDTDYRILQADVHLEHGVRRGSILLALPAYVGGEAAVFAPSMDSFFAAQEQAQATEFTADLCAQIAAVPAQIDAVLTRIALPLEHVLRLQIGEVVALPLAGLDRIALQGIDGGKFGNGKLGQNRGMRAIRLTEIIGAVQGDGAAQGVGMGGVGIGGNEMGGNEMGGNGVGGDGMGRTGGGGDGQPADQANAYGAGAQMHGHSLHTQGGAPAFDNSMDGMGDLGLDVAQASTGFLQSA